jgi:hypothetical protein
MKKLKRLFQAAFVDAPLPVSHADLAAGAAMAETVARLLEAMAADLELKKEKFTTDAAFFRSIGVTPPGEER